MRFCECNEIWRGALIYAIREHVQINIAHLRLHRASHVVHVLYDVFFVFQYLDHHKGNLTLRTDQVMIVIPTINKQPDCRPESYPFWPTAALKIGAIDVKPDR